VVVDNRENREHALSSAGEVFPQETQGSGLPGPFSFLHPEAHESGKTCAGCDGKFPPFRSRRSHEFWQLTQTSAQGS
jgi:hypothetical protein